MSDIEVVITGLRPSEKLYEELLINADALFTLHPRIMKADEQFLPWEMLEPFLTRLDAACSHEDERLVRNLLEEMPLGSVDNYLSHRIVAAMVTMARQCFAVFFRSELQRNGTA